MDFMKIKEIANNRGTKEFYLYAETAFIHDGDKEYLIKLVDEAAKAKCDGIKFQILIENENANNTDLSNFNDIYKWIFTSDFWLQVINLAKQKNLEVTVLPIDIKAVQFCKDHLKYIDAIEVMNGKVTIEENRFASDVAKSLGFCGTGGSDAHAISDVGQYATVFRSAIFNEKDLLEALHESDYEPIACQREYRKKSHERR